MARRCDICEKEPSVGYKVSHSNRHTKRRWLPNLHRVKAIIEGTVRRIKVCSNCLKSNRVNRAV